MSILVASANFSVVRSSYWKVDDFKYIFAKQFCGIKPITRQCRILTHQRHITVENIVKKEEITCNKQFLLFSKCFLPYIARILYFKRTLKCRLQFVSIWTSFFLLRVKNDYVRLVFVIKICVLFCSKILSSGNGLTPLRKDAVANQHLLISIQFYFSVNPMPHILYFENKYSMKTSIFSKLHKKWRKIVNLWGKKRNFLFLLSMIKMLLSTRVHIQEPCPSKGRFNP